MSMHLRPASTDLPRALCHAGQKSAGVFETPAFFSFHHVNAFEASQQRLVVDTVALTGINFSNSFESGASMFEKPGKGVLTRLVIDGKTGQVSHLPTLHQAAVLLLLLLM